ncbi:MAG: hypothetical protein ACHQRJ_18130, partial [Alphaproteobacteria bacterium]
GEERRGEERRGEERRGEERRSEPHLRLQKFKPRRYPTVAIGLYGAAAGIPIETLFIIQDNYAWIKSRYPEGTVYDETYTHLPERNVGNTELGYELYKSGKIGPSKK